MNVKIAGTYLERSGRKDSDIYVEIFGKKIYLKKKEHLFLVLFMDCFIRYY